MKNNQQVFVILTPGFPSNESDSTCLPFLQHLVKAINKNYTSLKLIIIAFQYPFEAHEYLWNNNTVISFGGKNRGKLLRKILWMKVWERLNHIRKDNNIAGLFSLWLGECALLGKRFGERYNIPYKTWILGQDAKAANKYVATAKPFAKDLIAVSDFIANEFFKNYLIRPIHIIPNGINKTLFKTAAVERTIDVIGAGSLIPLKQYHVFVEVISSIKKKLANIQSVIAGAGSEKDSLQLLIINLEVANNILLKGEIHNIDLLALMQQSKIFLHTSSYEGFSMVCLEALYAGCHVISFCKPMNTDFKHWHVVKTKEEMSLKAIGILSQTDIEYDSVVPYSINDTANSIMKLFIDNTTANIV